MKFLTIAAFIMITILPACETSDHTHPLEEHTHNLNLDDLLPDSEQQDDTNFNDLLKVIEDNVAAINLMNDIVILTHSDIEAASVLYKGRVVTVRAPVEKVRLLSDEEHKPVHLYYLKNIRNISFYIVTYPPLGHTLLDPNPEILFEPGQTYTFTLLIEFISGNRLPGRRWGFFTIRTKLSENE